jgi:hypothetical protein
MEEDSCVCSSPHCVISLLLLIYTSYISQITDGFILFYFIFWMKGRNGIWMGRFVEILFKRSLYRVQQWIRQFGNTECSQLLISRENTTTTILQSLIYHSIMMGLWNSAHQAFAVKTYYSLVCQVIVCDCRTLFFWGWRRAYIVTVNSRPYVIMFENFLEPELACPPVNEDTFFQQDSVMSHTWRVSMNVVRNLFPNHVISKIYHGPPNHPICPHMTSFFGGI